MKTYKELKEAYPELYPHNFYFECFDGWLPRIHQMSQDIHEEVLKMSPAERKDFHITQIKEKFGGLRVYITYCHEAIEEHIARAESDCDVICEKCGKPGLPRKTAWIKTLCEKCLKAFL